jgi:hypothetical protein
MSPTLAIRPGQLGTLLGNRLRRRSHAALLRSSECAFSIPAFGRQRRDIEFIAFDELHGDIQALLHAVSKELTGAAAKGRRPNCDEPSG